MLIYFVLIQIATLDIINEDNFVYLMEFHWKEVSVYLTKAWEKRTHILTSKHKLKY